MKSIKELSRRLSVALIKAVGMQNVIDKLAPTSDAELCLMYALSDGRPHSQRQIADGLGISRTTINGIVNLMSVFFVVLIIISDTVCFTHIPIYFLSCLCLYTNQSF